MKKFLYLDNAATTPVIPEVFEAMKPYFMEKYGNPSSVYSFAGEAKKAVENAREIIAGSIGANPNEIYFTAGGSEANNHALISMAEAYRDRGNHIITCKIEHHAILHTCKHLEKQGFQITYLDVDENGIIDLEQLKRSIKPETILISIMYANNEIGTIEPIREIGKIARENNIFFHTDGVQAYGHVPINVDEDNIDLLSASGHKLNGPKGVGFLYIRKGIKMGAFIHGGGQERNRRAGTHNVPAIVGMGKAVEIAVENMEENIRKQTKVRDYFINRVMNEMKYVRVNGDINKRLPNNINICFRFIEGESLLIMLDMKGICASSGSACTSGSLDPSHVLLAIGLPHEIAHGSIRLTISSETTREDMDYVFDCLNEIVERLRSMSPLYEDFTRKEKENV